MARHGPRLNKAAAAAKRCGVHASLALLTGRVACWRRRGPRIGGLAKNARTTWSQRGTHPCIVRWSLALAALGPCKPATQACKPASQQACNPVINPVTLPPMLGSCRRETAPIISHPHREPSACAVSSVQRCDTHIAIGLHDAIHWSRCAGSLSDAADASLPTLPTPAPSQSNEQSVTTVRRPSSQQPASATKVGSSLTALRQSERLCRLDRGV